MLCTPCFFHTPLGNVTLANCHKPSRIRAYWLIVSLLNQVAVSRQQAVLSVSCHSNRALSSEAFADVWSAFDVGRRYGADLLLLQGAFGDSSARLAVVLRLPFPFPLPFGFACTRIPPVITPCASRLSRCSSTTLLVNSSFVTCSRSQ